MKVGSRIVELDAYRVEIDHGGRILRAAVPEAIMDPALPGAPRHTPHYEWLARNRARIEAAVVARAEGRTPRAPFDLIELLED